MLKSYSDLLDYFIEITTEYLGEDTTFKMVFDGDEFYKWFKILTQIIFDQFEDESSFLRINRYNQVGYSKDLNRLKQYIFLEQLNMSPTSSIYDIFVKLEHDDIIVSDPVGGWYITDDDGIITSKTLEDTLDICREVYFTDVDADVAEQLTKEDLKKITKVLKKWKGESFHNFKKLVDTLL